MVISRRRVWLMLAIGVVSALLQHIYASWAAEAYGYQGFVTTEFTLAMLAVQLVMLTATAFVLPLQVERPSDFFFLFYPWFVLVPFASLFYISGYVDSPGAIALYALLALPCLLIKAMKRLRVSTPTLPFLPEKVLIAYLLALAGIVFLMAYERGLMFSLDWASMYDRRMAGRDVIGTRNILAYGMLATINGLVPLLALLAGVKRNLALGIASIGIALAGFAAVGTKSPVAMSMLFLAIGWLHSQDKYRVLPSRFASVLLCIVLLGWFGFHVLGSDILLDVFIRRAFFVTAFNIGLYGDLISSYSLGELLYSGREFGGPITFFVGEHYYGNAATNANVNAFLLALSDRGLLWYLASAGAVGLFFAAVDNKFQQTGFVGYMLVGAVYGLLLAEQAWTTALVSSGALLIFVLLSLTKFEAGQESARRPR